MALSVREVKDTLEANIYAGEQWIDRLVQNACGSDLMSDVLAFVKDQSVLLTGLVNTQVIRTAEMMDMICVVFVRGKKPDQQIIDLANEREIVLLVTEHPMFTACGLLYEKGLRGGLAR